MLSPDLSTETLQAKREWHDIFKVMKRKNLQTKNTLTNKTHSDMMEKAKAFQTSKG